MTLLGWRNQVQASQSGVGLLLGPTARKALLKIKRTNHSIIVVEFDGHLKTTVIVMYSPTNCASEEPVEELYETLRNTISEVPAHNFLIVMGDFNAMLCSEHVP